MAIHIHLDNILRERQMTSKELCRLVNITEANLSILRSGKAKGVRFTTLNKICHYLQCDVGDILTCDGELEDDSDADVQEKYRKKDGDSDHEGNVMEDDR
ncbi:MAG: helix-turn-helix domain-containing protein [Clostridiales bacterium]|nr:helix-turn-helix domain-containing protein [Clostridiales bacterium]